MRMSPSYSEGRQKSGVWVNKKTCLWERDLLFLYSSWLLLQGEVLGKKETFKCLNSSLEARCSPLTLQNSGQNARHAQLIQGFSSCFRHYKQQGKWTLTVPLQAAPVISLYQVISKWLLCKTQMPAELHRTQQCLGLLGSTSWTTSCGVPLEKSTEIKSKQLIVLTNRGRESLPLDIVHCKQTSNNGTGPFVLFWFFWFKEACVTVVNAWTRP